MPEQIAYEEEWDGGTISEAKVGVAESGTRLFVAVEPTADGTYVLTKVDQRDTTVLKEVGLRLLPFALDRLRERFDLEAFGLVDDGKTAEELLTDDGDEWEPEQAELREEETPDENAHAKRNAEQLAKAEEVLEDDPFEDVLGETETDEEFYESAEAYLEDVDEATTAEIADAVGIDDPVDVHPELAEIDDDRLMSRPHPDDGRKKLYALDVDGSPPGEIDEATVVAVAEHYDTLSEVAEDLEVEPLRAHAILEEHGVRDEVIWHE